LLKEKEFNSEKIVDAAINVRKVLGPGKRPGFSIYFNVPLIKTFGAKCLGG
jgi:hypothetical protein